MVRAVSGASRELKGRLRAQTNAAGLGPKVANAWRDRGYPQDVAAIVYTRAGPIIEGFDRGGVIYPRVAQGLAIPTPEAGKGPGGRRITPNAFVRRTGIPLTFVPVRGRGRLVGLLVARERNRRFGVRKSGQLKGRQRRISSRSRANLTNRREVVVFLILSAVTLQKRLDVAGAAELALKDLETRVATEALVAFSPTAGRSDLVPK
jgi:hypothetical protein